MDPNQRVISLSENLQSLTANGGAAQSPVNGMVSMPAALSRAQPNGALNNFLTTLCIEGFTVFIVVASHCLRDGREPSAT